MKSLALLATLTFLSTAIGAEEAPKVFAGLLKQDTPVEGQLGMVLPPAEINKYIAKVEAAARKDREWFVKYSENAKPGLPLPYHEKIGLTKEEYNEYLKLWAQREFKANDEVMLLLRQSSGKTWTVTATGKASSLSTLRYNPETDTFRSPNGLLKRIEDIDAESTSILGAWSGKEWKFEEETSLGKTKENIAFGQFDGGKYGVAIYRVQEVTDAGTRLLDKSLVIRFPIQKD